jgi:DNA-binding GntR family transcriptional regulator
MNGRKSDMVTTRITRLSLHEEVLDRIRTMIVEGRWPPGARFPETEVCEELGVSRTPLREALKVLATEGLIELQTNRGAIIKVFTPKEAYDTLLLIGILEAYAGELACETITENQMAEIDALHQMMLGYHARGERQAYWAANRKIHEKIVDCAGNDALSEIHELLRTRMLRILYAGSNQPDFQQAAVDEHNLIHAALTQRNSSQLAAVLRDHQRHTWERVRPAVEEESQQDPSVVK